MAKNTFEQQVAPVETRIRDLQEPIEQLIDLSDEIDSLVVAEEAARIIDGMREAQSFGEQFRQLEALTHLSDELPQAQEVVTDTAEILLTELRESNAPAKLVGLNMVWSAVRAWDSVRNDTTADLCVKVLNNFKGEGQVNLLGAYVRAKEEELPFEEALDQLLAEGRSSIAA